jgi:hypothetical protein
VLPEALCRLASGLPDGSESYDGELSEAVRGVAGDTSIEG